jgi:GNAT superfamily N-acetyltransferase
MSKTTVEVADAPRAEDLAALTSGLSAANAERVAVEDWKRLTLFLRDDTGKLVGGLDGHTHWGWLFVMKLWLAAPFRGQGIGRELMARAEAEAKSRGCRNVHLDTYDFQALPFYEHLGYRVFGRLADYPKGYTRFFLEKRGL